MGTCYRRPQIYKYLSYKNIPKMRDARLIELPHNLAGYMPFSCSEPNNRHPYTGKRVAKDSCTGFKTPAYWPYRPQKLGKQYP
jgi:hypothetical protein